MIKEKLTIEEVQKMIEQNDGNLDLHGIAVKSLPENLVVGGNLDLSESGIEILPDNLIVSGNLDLAWSRIESLPENLMVGGWIDVSGLEIESLPESLKVGKEVFSETWDEWEVCTSITYEGVKTLQDGELEEEIRKRMEGKS